MLVRRRAQSGQYHGMNEVQEWSARALAGHPPRNMNAIWKVQILGSFRCFRPQISFEKLVAFSRFLEATHDSRIAFLDFSRFIMGYIRNCHLSNLGCSTERSEHEKSQNRYDIVALTSPYSPKGYYKSSHCRSQKGFGPLDKGG